MMSLRLKQALSRTNLIRLIRTPKVGIGGNKKAPISQGFPNLKPMKKKTIC
jgi:hypothetical protein